jgi:hypothetical protein
MTVVATNGATAASGLAIKVLTTGETRELGLQALTGMFGLMMVMGRGLGNTGPDNRESEINEKVFNCNKQESPVWKSLRPYKGQARTDGNGRFFNWDGKHNDLEVFERHAGEFKHIGSMDPITDLIYKSGVGHKIRF